jgi:uncharacterized membrane protein
VIEFSFVAQEPDGLGFVLYYLRAIGGFLFVFILPGFVWTLVTFRKLQIIERVIVSFGLSIAIVALVVYVPNITMGIIICGINTLISTAAITVAALLLYTLRQFKGRGIRDQ